MNATCPNHPGESAVANCTRCGTFLCSAELTIVDGAGYCPACAAREDVDYLEAFRKKYWGKRDSWAWTLGLGAPVQLLLGMVALVTGPPEGYLAGVLLVLSGVNSAFFFFGAPLTRVGLVLLTVAWTATYAFTLGPAAIVSGIVSALVVTSILTTTRTKLFFKMDVPRPALAKCWDQLANNAAARTALALSVGGLIIPGFGLLAIIVGVIGLSQVNRKSRPPVGKAAHAIAGIVLGVLGSLMSGFVLWNAYRNLR